MTTITDYYSYTTNIIMTTTITYYYYYYYYLTTTTTTTTTTTIQKAQLWPGEIGFVGLGEEEDGSAGFGKAGAEKVRKKCQERGREGRQRT